MPKIDDETLRKRYQKAKEDWEKRQKENRARRRHEKIQADARRDALIAKMVRHQVQADPSKHDRLITQMDSFLDDAKDRALFDLPPKPAVPDSVSPDDPSSLVDTPRS